jgi:hypothetical protein
MTILRVPMAIAVGIYRRMTFGALAGGTPVLVGILRVSRHVGESLRFEERNIDAVSLLERCPYIPPTNVRFSD